MSVVGFDLGNDNCVVASVKPKAVHVLLNGESKYETQSVVTFGKKKRLIGSSGASTSTMNPRSTISHLKRLIGQRFDEPGMAEELDLLPFHTSKAPDGGILINVSYLDEDLDFTPVQVLAMLLSHLKQMAERNLDVPVSNCVIGIPSYFTDLQGVAYLDAAKIAGLNPVRLMHDGAAIALGYGMHKSTDVVEDHVYVVFVDVGHCDTQVTVTLLVGGEVRVLSHESDRNLGGRDFDKVLFEYFAEQFQDEHGIDVSRSLRAKLRLMNACEELKRVLTANTEAHITIECLVDEKDLSGCIRREEFEELSSDLLERIVVPCEKALEDAGLTAYDVHDVELVGSGSRVPAISRILREIFLRQPSRTLNARECIARGCALQCAMLSPNPRITNCMVQDIIPFTVGYFSKSNHITLLQKAHRIPEIVVLTFRKKTHTFHFDILCTDQSELTPRASQKFRRFKVGPFKLRKNELANVEVKLCLSLDGFIILVCASLNKVKLVKGKLSPSSMEIQISEVTPIGMTEREIFQAQDQEDRLADHDSLIEDIQGRKNDLEGFVYDIRKKLAGKYSNYATASEKQTVSNILAQIEAWLYEDSDDESVDAYSSKLEQLHELVIEIENRYQEQSLR